MIKVWPTARPILSLNMFRLDGYQRSVNHILQMDDKHIEAL